MLLGPQKGSWLPYLHDTCLTSAKTRYAMLGMATVTCSRCTNAFPGA